MGAMAMFQPTHDTGDLMGWDWISDAQQSMIMTSIDTKLHLKCPPWENCYSTHFLASFDLIATNSVSL